MMIRRLVLLAHILNEILNRCNHLIEDHKSDSSNCSDRSIVDVSFL